MLKSFLFSSILLPQPPALYTILHQISAPTVPFKNLYTGRFSFFPITRRLYIHPNDGNSPLYKGHNHLYGWDKDDKRLFIEIGLTCPEGFLDGTITIPFLVITGKYTIFLIDDGSYQIALFICINHSLLINHRPCLG